VPVVRDPGHRLPGHAGELGHVGHRRPSTYR
jgi:hypothetical protein